VLRNARDPWDDAAIDAALCRTGVLRVPLARPIRVTVFYATAVATQSEGVLFFDDVYGNDRRLRQLLDERRKTSS
jgi:murein L,D-transpeptidase YcbB/YkuD